MEMKGVLRANYSFRAIVVPKGEHLVEFKYEPDSFRYGIYASTAGFLSLLVIILIKKKKYLF